MSGPSRVRRRVAVLTACAAIAIGLGLLLRPDKSSSAPDDVARTSTDDKAPEPSGVAVESPALAAAKARSDPPRARRGLVLLPDGHPARGAVLYLVPKRGGPPVRAGAPAGRDGRVDLPERTASSWLRAEASDGIPADVDGDALPDGEVVFRLRPPRALHVVLEGFEDFPLDMAQIEWRATDDSGRRMRRSVPRETHTVVLSVAHDGPIEVTAWHARFVANPSSVRLERAEGTVTFRMERGSKVSLRAVDEPSGERAVFVAGRTDVRAGREILFSTDGGADGEGEVRIERALPPGVYDVDVHLARRRSTTVRVVVERADEDPSFDLRLRPDTEQGLAQVRCDLVDDGRPGTPPFFAAVRNWGTDGGYRDREAEGAWHAVACAVLEPTLVGLGPLPAGVYDLMVWDADGRVGAVVGARVASDRIETSSLGLWEGVIVDVAVAAARRTDARVLRVTSWGGTLPLVTRAGDSVTLLGETAPASARLGPYPFAAVEVDWQVGDGEPATTRVDR